jgi:GT2 family glycosyltransferase
MAARPRVDVVVPFAGTAAALDGLLRRAGRLELRPGDSVTVVDNSPAGSVRAMTDSTAGVRLVTAPERQSSYHARNEGARAAGGDWLLFLDADVDAPANLIDRYFERPPGERTGVLAGGVTEEPAESSGKHSLAERYEHLRTRMTQGNTLRDDEWAYAQTANCAVRRSAFAEAGGFRDELRSGGDADLCFRLRARGWEMEERAEALVVHRSRSTLRKMLRQRARHGSGAGWLEREYPGSFPRRPLLGLSKWTLQSFLSAPVKALRGRSDDALLAVVDPLEDWAFELGRLFPNTTRARR